MNIQEIFSEVELTRIQKITLIVVLCSVFGFFGMFIEDSNDLLSFNHHGYAPNQYQQSNGYAPNQFQQNSIWVQ